MERINSVHTLMRRETPAVAKYSSSRSKEMEHSMSAECSMSPYCSVAFTYAQQHTNIMSLPDHDMVATTLPTLIRSSTLHTFATANSLSACKGVHTTIILCPETKSSSHCLPSHALPTPPLIPFLRPSHNPGNELSLRPCSTCPAVNLPNLATPNNSSVHKNT